MRLSLFMFGAVLFLISCGPANKERKDGQSSTQADRQQLLTEMDGLEDKMRKNSAKTLDKVTAMQLIQRTMAFASDFPEDEQTPEVLFRAAEVARGIKDHQKALQLFGLIHRDYPKFERAPYALFLKAFILENSMNDKEEAKKYYKHFLERYPDHKLKTQVEQLLQVVDRTPEEMVKEFKVQQR